MVRGMCYPSLVKQNEPESSKKLHVGGIEGISCQHFQVMMTNLLQKHWEWREDRRPMIKHGVVKRPTMYLASLDIKTAFDVARQKGIARIMEDHNVHGWIIAALLLRQGSVEAPRLRLNMAMQILANVEQGWAKKEWASSWIRRDKKLTRSTRVMSHSKAHPEQMIKDLIQEAERWVLDPKLASLWWTSIYDSAKKM